MHLFQCVVFPLAPAALLVAACGQPDPSAVAPNEPLVRIDPDYPCNPAIAPAKDWIIVEFSVTPSGDAEDPRIVDSSSPGIAGDPVVQELARTVTRWRYIPQVEGGEPDPPHHVRARLELSSGARGYGISCGELVSLPASERAL